MDFTFSIKEQDGISIISLEGNLIEKNQATELIEEIESLIEKNASKFILNMASFKYMNSTGLNVMINILTKARKAGGEAVICSMPDKIKELMVITKLNSVFTIAETLEEAIQKLK
jgi:anti-sigma B factor antagonist